MEQLNKSINSSSANHINERLHLSNNEISQGSFYETTTPQDMKLMNNLQINTSENNEAIQDYANNLTDDKISNKSSPTRLNIELEAKDIDSSVSRQRVNVFELKGLNGLQVPSSSENSQAQVSKSARHTTIQNRDKTSQIISPRFFKISHNDLIQFEQENERLRESVK